MNEGTLTLLGNVSLALAALWLVLQILVTVFSFVKSQKNGNSTHSTNNGISNIDLQVVQQLSTLTSTLSGTNALLQQYVKEDKEVKEQLLGAVQATDNRTQIIDKNMSKALHRQLTPEKLRRILRTKPSTKH